MQMFHPNERLNESSILDGEVDAFQMKRTAVKLSTGPKIVVAIPIGSKSVTSVLPCPKCKERGEEHSEYQVDVGFRPEALVPVPFMFSQMNWLPPLNVTMAYTYKTGMLSSMARQVMTREAMKIDTVKYIFYVDDDMIIPQMGLYQLYNLMERNPDWGAVTGVYTTRNEMPEPLIYTDHGKGAAWDLEMGPGAAPTHIFGAGAGCLLARVSAIRAWQDANPDCPVWADSIEVTADGSRITWGHDIRFVRNLTEAGWPCYADGSLLCGHYDIKSRKTVEVPADAPGLKKRMSNSATYWDDVYTKEGGAQIRATKNCIEAIVEHVPDMSNVVELACGTGALGQQIVGRRAVHYTGYDHSAVAAAQCQARGLQVHQLDLRNLKLEHFTSVDATMVIASAILEHLTDELLESTLTTLRLAGKVKRLVVTVPDDCLPPEDWHEHERVFTEGSIRQLLTDYGWDVQSVVSVTDLKPRLVVLATRE